jgi:cellulose synthase (UDP-forming)
MSLTLDDRAPARDAALEPAQPSPTARAARAFGDAYPEAVRGQWRLRGAGILYAVAVCLYVPWLLRSLNGDLPWLSWPFVAANAVTIAATLLAIANQWFRSVPVARPLPRGAEPLVGVIVPTCGEPVPMVLRTVASLFEQDWPAERMVVLVSDDGHDPALAAALATYPVTYHSPPARWAPGRDGAAKAGNLNSALERLRREHPDVRYIETRDADDELPSTAFLRQVIGQLEADERLAFVQTIKEAQVSPGDPFNNREPMFYRGQMLARHAANAVFPCGSGLVWRRAALEDIGDFPTWNLVEDLQSGVEALRRGWRSCYLPIVGAVGQHAPEDVPNVLKQRGTWAIDTVRLTLWGDLRGLGLRQRAHFAELVLYYLQAFTVLAYVPAIVGALLGFVPVESDALGFALHLLPLVVAFEVWLLVYNVPFHDRRRSQRQRFRALWSVRVLWSGLSPVFMKATLQAVAGGPRRKPIYKVTRKHDDVRWHWSSTLPHTTLVLAVVAVLIYALRFGTLPSASLLAGAVYWGGLNVVLLCGFITRGWHGMRLLPRVLRRSPPQAPHPAAP